MPQPRVQIYEFGSFRLDVRERLLLKDGACVALTPKAFEVLCVLVARAGRLVSKEELIGEVWPDSFVEEGSLARNVYLLRKTLGEGPTGEPYIQTVPRQGYRFVIEVRTAEARAEVSGPAAASSDAEAAPASTSDAAAASTAGEQSEAAAAGPHVGATIAARRPWHDRFSAHKFAVALSALLAASAVFYVLAATSARREPEDAAVRSLAILPFKSIDARAGDEQLGLGMADSILTRLSRLPGVSVLPTTAVFKYSGRERDPVAAGRELGVDAVLDGTMQRSDGRIRVTAQLVRTSDSRTLWAAQFDEPLSGILSLQDSVSEQVALTVAPQFGAGPGQPKKRYSENAAAYESYLMGFFFWGRRDKENLTKAFPYLKRAVELDPDFALARAVLADCYYIDAAYDYGIHPPEEAMGAAEAEASRALALDASIAEAHIVMAQIKSGLHGDSAAAEAAYKRGLELNPNYATGRIRYAYELFFTQRLDEALREARRGQGLDPLSPAANGALSFMLVMSRDYDAAIKFGRRALELNPRLTVARVNLGEAYFQKQMYREAFGEFQQLSEVDPALAAECLANAHARAGELGKARAHLSRLRRAPQAGRTSVINAAALRAAFGETDEALRILETADLNRHALAMLRFDPQWDALRSERRFADLLRRGRRP